MTRLIILAVSLASMMTGPADHPQAIDDLLDRVETRIQMPPGAEPIGTYWRSYFPVQGGKKVQASYSKTHAPGRQWVATNPGPFIADGGCSVITVVIDVASERVEKAECNGVG